MAATDTPADRPTDDTWQRVDQCVEGFEQAWQSGRTPAIDDYLPERGPDRLPVLIELVHVDLERHLRAGESARVEQYLTRFPELATDPVVVGELVAAEYQMRRRLDPALTPTEYQHRFPQFVPQLETHLTRPHARRDGTSAAAGTANPRWAISQGRFRPQRFHARGGLGEVYVAEDQELQREVALKRIQERFADEAEPRRHFLREAQITSRLGHPGIVPVYGLVEDDRGRPCYAMRFIEGTSFEDAIAAFHQADQGRRDPGERSLALRELLSQFVTVCNTVAYAHSRGIVHCDLKPANIMLGKFNETLVIDWGLARPFGRTEEQRASGEDSLLPPTVRGEGGTCLGEAKGTPAFMSPEQAAGQWDVVGPASDLYGLGATLYNLLTGKVPFQGTVREVLQKVQQGQFPSPRQLKPSTPPGLDAICRKAMARKREERYGTVLELATDVTHWLADEKVSAHRESLAARLARWRRRNRTTVTAAVLVLVLLVVGGSAGFLLWQRAEQRRHEYLAELNGSAEIDEQLALEELQTGRFARAEEILRPAIQRLEHEPALAVRQSRLAAMLDRAHRLAQFYQLADETERREAVQTTGEHYYGESGAAEVCVKGLKQLGVFEHPDWWEHLPDDDLRPQQRADLREDVYHQLLLLGAIRAKPGARLFGTSGARTYYQPAADALGVANRFRPDAYSGPRMEAAALLGMVRGNEIRPFKASEPSSATDHYFLGLSYLGIGLLLYEEGYKPAPLTQILIRQGAAMAGLDVRDPFGRAVFHFQRSADLRPKHYWSHCWLGLCSQLSGKPTDAELAANTCIALRTDYVLGYHLRGAAIMQQWQRVSDPQRKTRLLERGLADFTRAIDFDSTSPFPYLQRAGIYVSVGDSDRAIRDCTEAIRLDPSSIAAFDNRGWLYYQRREFDRALADFTELLRLHPNKGLIYNVRANVCFHIRDYDRAAADCTEAIKAGYRNATVYADRASAYTAKGDAERAAADWEAAARLDPRFATDDQRGATLARHGLWTEAVARFVRFTERNPDSAAGWHLLGVAHLGSGDEPAYRRVCARMLERFGTTREPYAASDVLYASLPGGPDVVEWNDQLTQLADAAAPCWKGNVRVAGAVAYRRGQWQEAVRRFAEAEKVWRLRPWDWLFLAMAHHRLKQTEKAREYFGRAVAWIDAADLPGVVEGGAGPSWGAWNEGVEVRALRREAERLLRGKE